MRRGRVGAARPRLVCAGGGALDVWVGGEVVRVCWGAPWSLGCWGGGSVLRRSVLVASLLAVCFCHVPDRLVVPHLEKVGAP